MTMISAKEAVQALREVLEDGDYTYSSRVESRLADVEEAFARMSVVSVHVYRGDEQVDPSTNAPIEICVNDRIVVTRRPDATTPMTITIPHVPKSLVPKNLVPESLRVFRFGEYALVCPRSADVCSIEIAGWSLWNDSADTRRYFIAVVGYEGTEAAEHFAAPADASVFSKWEDWYSEVLQRAAQEYLAASLVAGRKAEQTGSLVDFEFAGLLDSTVWAVSQWFKRGSVPVPAKTSAVPTYLATLRDDVASRLSGLPGKVPE